jgi:putative ABC transport system permease protein
VFGRRPRREPEDFAAEVRAHLDLEEARLRDEGLSAEEAHRRARLAFGNPVLATEHVYEASRWRGLERLWQDVRYGARLMRRSKRFTLVAMLVLSLGIGVNTALFSIVSALFFRPLPVERPGELVYFYSVNQYGQVLAGISPDQQKAFRSAGADLLDFTGHWRVSQTLSVDNDTELASGEWVEHNYFDVLGVKPVLGRLLGPAEDDPANPEVGIDISYDLWTGRFRADPNVLGTSIRVGERYATIIGVMGPGFRGLSDPFRPTEYWEGLQGYVGHGIRPYADALIARMKPGVTFPMVQAFVDAETPVIREQRLDRLDPAAANRFGDIIRRQRFEVRRAVAVDMPFNPDAQIVPTKVIVAVTMVVALVLFIATANIAGLLLARGVTRTGEIAVRRALGAGGLRLVRQLVTESVLLSVGGGVFGVALAVNLVTLFEKDTPSTFAVDVPLDWRVLLFAVGICVGAGVLVGLAPALQALKVNVFEALGSGIVGARHLRRRLRHGIVVPQIALSLVLLLVAGVHVRALLKIELADLGYRPDHAVVLRIDRWEPRQYAFMDFRQTADDRQKAENEEAAKIRTFNRAVLRRVANVPGIAAFGLVDALPLSPCDPSELQSVISQDAQMSGDATSVDVVRTMVSDGYFDAMGITPRQGRTFDGRDVLYGEGVAVVSASVARNLWPKGDALGKLVAFEPAAGATDQKLDWLKVVGVVGDVRPVLGDGRAEPRVYVSVLQQWSGGASNLVVRGRNVDQSDTLRALKAAVVGADTYGEVLSVQTLPQVVGDILYPRRIASGILVVAGLIGLALACIGLYGVVSYSVAQRLRELGIRATLGASRRQIMALVVREGTAAIGLGCAAGFVLALTALRVTAGLIPGVPPVDLPTFVGAPLSLAAVVVLACYLPARRAARLDPMHILREL